jgi:hypothetical protein
MKSSIFWGITTFSPLKVNRRFGEEHMPSSFGPKNNPSKETSVKLGEQAELKVDRRFGGT